jgi:hypothetical protein
MPFHYQEWYIPSNVNADRFTPPLSLHPEIAYGATGQTWKDFMYIEYNLNMFCALKMIQRFRKITFCGTAGFYHCH